MTSVGAQVDALAVTFDEPLIEEASPVFVRRQSFQGKRALMPQSAQPFAVNFTGAEDPGAQVEYHGRHHDRERGQEHTDYEPPVGHIASGEAWAV